MKAIKYFTCILLITLSSRIYTQDNNILIFDPNGVSKSFQSTLVQLTHDSIFVADSLDDSIYNYNAAFIFINYPYIMSQTSVDRLINFTSAGNPLYVFSQLCDSTSITFGEHIGITWGWLLISGIVDSVTGIDTTFTNGIFIDTSWYSGIPSIYGDVQPILTAWYHFPSSEFYSTYMSGYDSLNVILDLFNLIDDYGFLERVLQHFNLIPPNDVDNNSNLVSGFKLLQNFPNPFNPVTSIQYAVASRQFVSLKVYDVLGNEIATLVNEEKLAGEYKVAFDATNLPSGVYFYQLKVSNYIETKKMVLKK